MHLRIDRSISKVAYTLVGKLGERDETGSCPTLTLCVKPGSLKLVSQVLVSLRLTCFLATS